MTAKEKLRRAIEELSEPEAQDTLGYIVQRRRDAWRSCWTPRPWTTSPRRLMRTTAYARPTSSSRGASSIQPKRSSARSVERRRAGLRALGAREARPQAPRPVQRRVIGALDRLTSDPPAGDVVRLSGVDDEWRLRVGEWRIRFTQDPAAGLIQVLRVLPRGRAYRD